MPKVKYIKTDDESFFRNRGHISRCYFWLWLWLYTWEYFYFIVQYFKLNSLLGGLTLIKVLQAEATTKDRQLN